MKKRLQFHGKQSHVVLVLLALGLLAAGYPGAGLGQDYVTPGSGVTWTLDNLVAQSGGVVTGQSPNYQLNGSLIITATDAINIAPATAITLTVAFSEEDQNAIVVLGSLTVQGSADNPVLFTGADPFPDAWEGIIVVNSGSVNLSHAIVEYSDDGVYFGNVYRTAPGSVIDHCVIREVNDDAVDLEAYDAPTFRLTHSVLAHSGEDGLELEMIGRTAVTVQGCFFYDNSYDGIFLNEGNPGTAIIGNAFLFNGGWAVDVWQGAWNLQVSNNFMYQNGGGAGLNTFAEGGGGDDDDDVDFSSGGENAFIQANIIVENDAEGIYARNSSGHTIAGNAIAENGMGVSLDHCWNSLIVGNSLGETQLDGSLFDTALMDLPFGYMDVLAAPFEGNPGAAAYAGNVGSGILLENAVPGLGAEPAAYQWIEVNRTNATAWEDTEQDDGDDFAMDEASIGFEFPITFTQSMDSALYTHFQMQSNGSVELTTGAEQSHDFTDYEGRGSLTSSAPGSTFLFVNVDDWEDRAITGTEPMETHGGQQVRMDGCGYRHFNAGDPDGDGNTVPEECIVFRWYMNSYADGDVMGGSEFWSDFQAVLYPDGRIRWNTRKMDSRFNEYCVYSGLYAGENPTPLEIKAGWDPGSKTSFLFDPKKARETTTQIAGNDIIGNGEGGNGRRALGDDGCVALSEAYYTILRGNNISSDFEGIILSGNSGLQSYISFNNIVPPEDEEKRRVPGTYLSVVNLTPGTAYAEYNYWGLGDPDGYVVGDVDMDPWLDIPVSSTQEVGFLIMEPFAMGPLGGVVTSTRRVHPGTVVSVPPGALFDDEVFTDTRKVGGASVVFTMGDLLPIPTLPPDMEGIGIPFVFTKNGAQFNEPVTITMPYQGYTPPTHVYYFDPLSLTWKTDGIVVLSVDEEKRTITFTTTHFSVFAAGKKGAGGAADGSPGPYQYHRQDFGSDHMVPCFAGALGNGGMGAAPALALLMALAGMIVHLRRKRS